MQAQAGAVVSSAPALLTVENLCKGFDQGGQRVRVLDGACLTLREGEVVALLGPSGGGKSTLLSLIAGIEAVDGGQIRIQGQAFSRWNDRGRTLFRRRHIGVIYQFFNLVPTLTVSENLRLPLQLNRLPEAGKVTRMLQALGLAGMADRFPEQLSGGEQQRVAIGRALIHQPPLLLADEPTGSLDAASSDRVMALLLEQVRATGQGLLLVTHNPDLCSLADRTVHLHKGVLEEF